MSSGLLILATIGRIQLNLLWSTISLLVFPEKGRIGINTCQIPCITRGSKFKMSDTNQTATAVITIHHEHCVGRDREMQSSNREAKTSVKKGQKIPQFCLCDDA